MYYVAKLPTPMRPPTRFAYIGIGSAHLILLVCEKVYAHVLHPFAPILAIDKEKPIELELQLKQQRIEKTEFGLPFYPSPDPFIITAYEDYRETVSKTHPPRPTPCRVRVQNIRITNTVNAPEPRARSPNPIRIDRALFLSCYLFLFF